MASIKNPFCENYEPKMGLTPEMEKRLWKIEELILKRLGMVEDEPREGEQDNGNHKENNT
jgi:hypothetical protein